MMQRTIKSILKRAFPQPVIDYHRRREYEASLSEAAKVMREQHRQGLSATDCGPEAAVKLTAQWLCRTQDKATPPDGGVARHYSLNTGWSPSYPETTGYIVPTFFTLHERFPERDFENRARTMLDWLVGIQLDSGAFQGGMITHDPVPVTFNTGQILLGLAAGAQHFNSERYNNAMLRAAEWLRNTQDDDGCWRRYATPFAAPGDKTYETHVAWGLLEADRVAPGSGFGDAGLRQIRWALSNIQPNGWIRDCCLSDASQPLTHTLGYALRGIIEGYRFNDDRTLLSAAEQVAGGLLGCVGSDGRLSGRFNKEWQPTVEWVCLTGSVQIAASFLDLHTFTNDPKWRDAAFRLNSFVRKTMVLDGDPDITGAIAGSFPIDGDYGRFEYLNWAAKFFVDSNLFESRLVDSHIE